MKVETLESYILLSNEKNTFLLEYDINLGGIECTHTVHRFGNETIIIETKLNRNDDTARRIYNIRLTETGVEFAYEFVDCYGNTTTNDYIALVGCTVEFREDLINLIIEKFGG